MGQKIKHRQTDRKPKERNYAARDMILNGTGKAQIMRDRRDRRVNDQRNSWQQDWDT